MALSLPFASALRSFDRRRWRDLVRDPHQPRRTVFGFAAGALIGATPILGLHTWAAMTTAPLLRLPIGAVVVGTNLSNPITFVPITLLEIRIGQWMWGRPATVLPTEFDAAAIGRYVLEAWTGYLVVGPGLAILAAAAMAVLLAVRARGRRGREAHTNSGPPTTTAPVSDGRSWNSRAES